MATALHIAPHPDDELLGCGGTLLRLRDAGWTIVNLGCSLGRSDQHQRRRDELRDACRRAGFTLRLPVEQIAIGADDDLAAAQARLADEIQAAMAELRPALVISPSPHDDHHGHEVVGRATRDALQAIMIRPRWWIWTLWGHAPTPSLFVELDEAVLERTSHALGAHRGELARAPYERLLRARAEVVAVLGSEQVFGWGSPGPRAAYAEILTELLTDRGDWPLAGPRRLNPDNALDEAGPRGLDLGDWLQSAGPRTRLLDRGGPAPQEGRCDQA